MEVAPWSIVLLGIDINSPLEKGRNPNEVLLNAISLENNRSFFIVMEEGMVAQLHFRCLQERADVTVNGKAAGTILYKPYTLDITPLLQEGENTIDWTVTGSIANVYGNPTKSIAEGAEIRLLHIR